MQITVIGKNYFAKKLSDYLAQNKDDIVFTLTQAEIANKIDLNPKDSNELKDFISANEIGLLIVADFEYAGCNFSDVLNETECCVFCPERSALRFCLNLSSGKKFAYKNKIQTTKFAVFEKSQQAFDYIQTADFPIVIMPDSINKTQPPFIAETKEKAKRQAEFLFQTGNKRILIENYIHGTEYTAYIITDGINSLNLIDTVSYFDEISSNNTKYVDDSHKAKIKNELIPSFLNAFMEEGIEYQGILGIKFIIDNKGEIYFSKFKPFFDELETDIFLNTVESDIKNLFYSASTGELLNNFGKAEINSKYVITEDLNGEILTGCANTMSKAIDLLLFEGGDKKAISEAISHWKR